jgi:glycosyltransferase involved in cell wall biosynthesis
VRAAPSISILLPVRDGARHLPDAIASLETQTDPDFEVIVVDDGSTDETPDLLGEWAGRDDRVRVLRQAASGIVTALERAREAARGVYLARMDADDVCRPDRLRRQRAMMADDDSLVACGCRVRYFPRSEVAEGARRYQAWINRTVSSEDIERDMFVECPLAHPTFFLRSDAVEAIGGYRDAGWAEDYDLILRLWEYGGRFAKVPAVLLRWREGPDRLSRTDSRYSLEAFVRCRVHFLARTLLRGKAGTVIWGAGPVGKSFSRALHHHGVPVLAFVEVDPRKIGQQVHGAPVVGTAEGGGIRDALHLAAVGQPGARHELRSVLGAAGLREMRDFVAVA